jgi:hypothetical protein
MAFLEEGGGLEMPVQYFVVCIPFCLMSYIGVKLVCHIKGRTLTEE